MSPWQYVRLIAALKGVLVYYWMLMLLCVCWTECIACLYASLAEICIFWIHGESAAACVIIIVSCLHELISPVHEAILCCWVETGLVSLLITILHCSDGAARMLWPNSYSLLNVMTREKSMETDPRMCINRKMLPPLAANKDGRPTVSIFSCRVKDVRCKQVSKNDYSVQSN